MIDADRFYSSGEALSRDQVPVTAQLMPGQIVIPKSLLEFEASLVEGLTHLFQEHGLQIRNFTVGSDGMKRDPQTGVAQFDNEPLANSGTILTGAPAWPSASGSKGFDNAG